MKPRIITAAPTARHSEPWQITLREAIRDSATLLDRLGIARHEFADRGLAIDVNPRFGVLVPEPYLRRMRRGDPHDPLLRQVLALQLERVATPGFVDDPLAEQAAELAPGLLRKYRGRALLIAATSCAVNCRYCFRRNFPYQAHRGAQALPAELLDALRADTGLREIVLSGGDPLMLRDEALAELIAGLAEVPHLRTLRVHTRLPVVIPSRISDRLVEVLTQSRLRSVMVLHVNHPAELDAEVCEALAPLRNAGVTLLNQSVLLRGVNDDLATLMALSDALHAAGVLPYYLHLLDPVTGTAHFDVPEPEAIALHAALRAELPGYLVPRLVREIPGRSEKTVIA